MYVAQIRGKLRFNEKPIVAIFKDGYTSALFRLFLGYRAEKKVTTRNSLANPLAVSQPGDSTDRCRRIAKALGRTSDRRKFIEEKN